MTNQNTRKQNNEPIRTRSKYRKTVPSAGKPVQEVRHGFGLVKFRLVKKVVQVPLTNHRVKKEKPKQMQNYSAFDN